MGEINQGRVYRKTNHDGIWALRGDRLTGLDVLLSEGFTDSGSFVILKRRKDRSQMVWELHIDNLVGPFRNHHHPALKGHLGNRRNFQAAYSLDITEEGLEDGDNVLKALWADSDR